MKNDLVSLLGLVRENRFSYARALIDPDMRFSMLSIDVAEDLRCREHAEDLGTFNVRIDEKTYKVLDVCRVDKAVLNGYVISISTIFHIIDLRRGEGLYEAFIGKDLFISWGLYIDPYTGIVRSRFGRRELLF